jgi:hypothetical protein
MNYLCQILNVHGINDVRQTAMPTAKPLIPKGSYFKVELPIEKLKRYESPCTDQILAHLIQAGVNTLCSEIHRHINSR